MYTSCVLHTSSVRSLFFFFPFRQNAHEEKIYLGFAWIKLIYVYNRQRGRLSDSHLRHGRPKYSQHFDENILLREFFVPNSVAFLFFLSFCFALRSDCMLKRKNKNAIKDLNKSVQTKSPEQH